MFPKRKILRDLRMDEVMKLFKESKGISVHKEPLTLRRHRVKNHSTFPICC